MSDNERRSLSLRVALLLDDQVARLSSLGYRFESLWYSISRFWDLETIGAFFAQRGYQLGCLLSKVFFPILLVLVWQIRALTVGWSWLAQRSMFGPVVCWAALAFARLVTALSLFLIELLRTRKPILWPMIAATILLMVPLAILGLNTFTVADLERGKNYRQAIQHEISRGNLDRVQLYQAKLVQLGIPYGQPEMQAVDRLFEQGNLAEAFELAQQMAPSERPGLAAAHLFLALACLRGESGLAATAAHQLAAKHLEHLTNISEKVARNGSQLPPELQYLEGLLKLQRNQISEAQETFQQLSIHYWPAAVMSLEIGSRLGRNLDSQVASERLLHWAQMQPAILDELVSDCYVIWYQTEKTLADLKPNFPATNDTRRFIAEHWLQRFPSNGLAAEAFLNEYRSTIESLASKGLADKHRAATLLNVLAGKLGVQNRDRLGHWLIPIIHRTQEFSELGEVLRLATLTNPPAVLLEIMGTEAIARGELASAQELLARAVRLDPNHGVAWNNLAVASKRCGSVASALEAANQAVRLEPNNDAMRLTRAMIAFELEDWDKSQEDLERVSQNQPDNREIHRYLAIVYERMGKTDKSSFHQLLAGK